WEYAARAGTETDWSCGGIECVDEVGWHRRHPDLNPLSWVDPASTYMRVATLCPNDWGIYDMSGNAFEWTADAVDRDLNYNRAPFPYAEEAVDPFRPIHPIEFSINSPQAFVVPSQPEPEDWHVPVRVVRGGWAWSYPEGTRITMSQWAYPEQLGGVRL